MRPDRHRPRRAAAALMVTAVLGLLTVTAPALATTYVPINGEGSSWAANALDQWSQDVNSQGLTINYNPLGSAAGRIGFLSNKEDFAGSDIAFLSSGDPDPFGGVDFSGADAAYAYSYIPDVAGGTTFMYNVQEHGQRITNLRLSGQTIADIFTGHITNWDDPRITRDYGAQLPSLPITVVTRSDGSGASYMFTQWMFKQYPSLWEPFCHAAGGPSNCGPTEYFPGQHAGFRSLNGSDLAANYVASSANNGSIGYDEYSYAQDDSIPSVKLLNKAGYYVLPTASNVAIALEKAQIDNNPNHVTYLMQNLDAVYTDPDPRAYPLSSYSYLIVPRNTRTYADQKTYGPPPEFSTDKGKTLSTWINYMLCGAQQSAGKLWYSPLPKPMVQGGFLEETKIPGAVPAPKIGSGDNCHNPTYYNGRDVLTAEAPQPSPCDYKTAPLNCTVSNGKAVPAGPGGGPNGGGPNGTGVNSKNGNSPSGSGTNAAVDPNTGQLVSGSGAVNANVYAKPVGLAGQPGSEVLFGVLTSLEILAAIAVPATLGTWLQRRRRASPAGAGSGGRGGGR